MKEGMDKYAAKNRLQQKGYFYKHSDGGSGRKAREASRRDRLQQSRQVKEEEVEKEIEWYGKVVQLTEEPIEEIYESDGRKEEGRDSDTQQESSSGKLIPVQNVPRKQPRRKRKARDS